MSQKLMIVPGMMLGLMLGFMLALPILANPRSSGRSTPANADHTKPLLGPWIREWQISSFPVTTGGVTGEMTVCITERVYDDVCGDGHCVGEGHGTGYLIRDVTASSPFFLDLFGGTPTAVKAALDSVAIDPGLPSVALLRKAIGPGNWLSTKGQSEFDDHRLVNRLKATHRARIQLADLASSPEFRWQP